MQPVPTIENDASVSNATVGTEILSKAYRFEPVAVARPACSPRVAAAKEFETACCCSGVRAQPITRRLMAADMEMQRNINICFFYVLLIPAANNTTTRAASLIFYCFFGPKEF